MRILVTGGAGFIGSNLVDAYIKQGHEVLVVDNLISGKRENINPEAEFRYLDLGDPRLEEVFIDFCPEIINHHAAQIDVRKSVEDPLFDAQINILDALFLLSLAQKYRVNRFIFASTGGALYGEPEYIPCDEAHPIRPLAAYGNSKYCFEQYLLLFNRLYQLPYSILRYANVYGPRQDPFGEAGVVAIFSARLLNQEQPVIFGDGQQTRDFVYVGDIVNANLLSLESKTNLIVNLGTGEETSVNFLVNEMKQILGSELNSNYQPERAGEVRRIALLSQKAKELLGWEAKTHLRQGLEATIAYFRQALISGGV